MNSPEYDNALRILIAMVIALNVYGFGTLGWYISLRKSPWVSMRPFPVNIAASVLCLIYGNAVIPSSHVVTVIRDSVPCWFPYIMRQLFALAWFTMFMMRSAYLLYVYVRNMKEVDSPSTFAVNDAQQASKATSYRRAHHMNVIDKLIYRFVRPRKKQIESNKKNVEQVHNSALKLVWIRFSYFFIFYCIVIGICAATNTRQKLDSLILGNSFCFGMIQSLVVLLMSFTLLFLGYPLATYALRNIKDNYLVALELKVVMVIKMIAFLYMVADIIIPKVPKITWFFHYILALILHTISITIPCILAIINGRKSKRILLQYDQNSFQECLSTPELYQLLREHIAKDLCMENLLFYERVKELREIAQENNDKSHANSTMQTIYDEFIDANAINSLNISGKARRELLDKLNKGELKPEDFDPLLNDILDLIYRNNFPRFVDIYKDRLEQSLSNLHA